MFYNDFFFYKGIRSINKNNHLLNLPILFIIFNLGIYSFFKGNLNFSKYLQLVYIQGSGELSILLGAIFGSIIGSQLIFPNQSMKNILFLGIIIPYIAFLIKEKILFLIIASVYIFEGIRNIFFINSSIEKNSNSQSYEFIIRFYIINFILFIVGLYFLELKKLLINI